MKNKPAKTYISAIAAAIIILSALLLLSSCTQQNTEKEKEEEKPIIPEYTLSYVVDDDCASMGKIEGECEQRLQEETGRSQRVCAKPNLNYRFVSWSDGVKDPIREGDTVKDGDTTISARFEYSGFPELHIDYDGKIKRHEYLGATVSLSGASDDLTLEAVGASIRGRGNASWSSMPKKSYKLKFDEKVNLLGLGKEAHRDWVLISEYVDQSMVRNMFGYTLGSVLDNIEVAYNTAYVHLYFNGEYRGAYMVTEQVEVNSGRVDIDDSGEEKDIGYLVELDNYAGENADDVYFTVAGIPYSVKSDIHNDAQLAYITAYFVKVDAAIRSGNEEKIRALVDIPSCVDMYLLQEFTKNTDVGWSSFYMYKKPGNDHLFFGPAWDLDLSAGNDARIDSGDYEGLYTGKFITSAYFQMNQWYIELMSNEWFRLLVLDRWNEKKADISALVDIIERYGRENASQFALNFERWDILTSTYPVNQEPWSISILSTYDEHLDYLVNWYRQRLAWLDNYYNNEMAQDDALGGMPY